MSGPIDGQYEHVAAEAVAAAYPEGGWREHLARLERRVRELEEELHTLLGRMGWDGIPDALTLERRVRKIERWIEGDPDAPELEPPEREP